MNRQDGHDFELKNGLYICKWCHHPQRSYGKQNACVPHGGLIDVPRVPAGTPTVGAASPELLPTQLPKEK